MSNNMGERKKRRFGPSGSQLSDDYWSSNIRYKVPPIRIPAEELDAETFKEMLIEQEMRGLAIAESRRDTAQEMTKDLFFEILNDPAAKQRRKALSAKERMLTALEYFGRIDEDIWLNEQMKLLETVLDKNRFDAEISAYNVWKRLTAERIAKAFKFIHDKFGLEKAQAFAEYGWKYMESKKPKDLQPFTKIIRRRVRRLALRTDLTAMRDFSEEMHLIFSAKKDEPKPKLKRRRRKKKDKGLPPGKVPFPDPKDPK